MEGGRIEGCGYFPLYCRVCLWGGRICKLVGRASWTIPQGCSKEQGTLLSPGLLWTGAGLTLSTLQGVLNSRSSLISQRKKLARKGGDTCLGHAAL